ncbi:hypothetical protein [Nisaea sp.]|uniref:hypothetical protein n=1 Tax=Nisaea sp. TaxID=2024842 RepID=UPI002B2797C3|nr:hypothetical protein [Nisaea sp.]
MGQKIKTRMLTAGAVLSVVILSGCVTAMRGYSGVDNEGKRDYLRYAASTTPVCLTLSGSAFVDGKATASEVAVAAANDASGSIFGSPARFTADCASTAHPDYRIVILANAAIVGSPDQLCKDEPIATRQTAGKLQLDAAFCAKSEVLSTAWSKGPDPSGISDPVFGQMIRSLMNELFPINRERERGGGVFQLSDS